MLSQKLIMQKIFAFSQLSTLEYQRLKKNPQTNKQKMPDKVMWKCYYKPFEN